MESTEEYPPQPRPIQIIRPDNHNFKLNRWYEVKRIFESDKLRDHELVVVSIAGDYRKGKSFLLNYFLRYLNARYKKHDLKDDWIRNDDDTANRFHCRGGKERDTVGIWMWSEIFTHEFVDGKKVAIVLLDTQGIFDNESDMKECISIFAISMLLSSVQCYNVMHQVQENDLTNLQLFTEYARLAMKDTDDKPFQKLLFIVRDWASPYDHKFGGSKDYVKGILKKNPKQTTEMHELRDSIENSFDKINAYLMPYPGKAVAQSKCFVGKTKDMDSDFVKYIEELTEKLFAPKKLIPKKIGEETIKSQDFLELVGTYVNLFSGTELPQPISILQATAEAHLKACYNGCMDEYLDEMHDGVSDVDVYCEEDDLMDKHVKASTKAISRFQNRRKFGGLELQSTYLESLQKDIHKGYSTIHETNEIEKVTVQSKQKTIFVSTAGGLAVAGAIASVLVAGSLGLGLFASYAAASNSMMAGLVAGGTAVGGLGGAGIGAGVRKMFPRRWLGTESALSKAVKNLKESRKNQFGMNSSNDDNNDPLPSTSTETDNMVSSSNDAETTPLISDTISNRSAQTQVNNTPTSNVRRESIRAYEFDTPADRALVAEFLRFNSETNHFYILKMIFADIKNSFLRLLPRAK